MHIPRPRAAAAAASPATAASSSSAATATASSNASVVIDAGTPIAGGSARKPIRAGIKSSNADRDAPWRIISSGIKEIYQKNASQLSFEELYRNAYNMCLAKAGDRLYNGIRSVIVDHLESVLTTRIAPAFPHSATPSQIETDTFLKELLALWEDHTLCLGMVRDVLMYMDRTYVKTHNVLPTYEMGLEVFRDVIMRSKTHPTATHLTSTLLHQIQLERNGEVIDRMLIKGIKDMLLSLPVSSSVSSLVVGSHLQAGYATATSSVSIHTARVQASLYTSDFERVFLDASQTYYTRQGDSLLKSSDASTYLTRAEYCLADEALRVQHYLHSSTAPKLCAVVERELLERHIAAVIEMDSGFVDMVQNDRLDDLVRLYVLAARVPNGHVELRRALSAYIKECGRTINDVHAGGAPASSTSAAVATSATTTDTTSTPSSKTSAPIAWVEAIIALKDRMDTFLDHCFTKDKSIQTEINAALEHTVWQNTKTPEFLSLYLDDHLRKGIRGKTDTEIDTFLDKAITMFRFVREKDVFERYFKQHLAKRLLYGRSVSEDTEKSMIARLKMECGYQFTSKLEGMFKDMHVSGDLSSGFRAHVAAAESSLGAHNANVVGAASAADGNTPQVSIPDIFVYTLTSTFWPITAPADAYNCIMPPEITTVMTSFERFYLSMHSGRRLTWLRHMGTADLRAVFDKGRKELNVSTYAMIVLVQSFNTMESVTHGITFDRVRNETGIPVPDLRRTLQSLSLGKHRVLIKSTKGKDVVGTDVFRVNVGFTSPLSKIKILTIASSGHSGHSGGDGDTARTDTSTTDNAGFTATNAINTLETETERAETLTKIQETRRYQIEAAIVRVMKSRKTMRHTDLVSEVMSHVASRFAPDPVMIKKRIEGLIEREYLERDGDNRQVYHYLA